MTSNGKSVTVSAPGKILLAGGYLVLESPNAGFVVAADKRFYCTVGKRVETNDGNPGSTANNTGNAKSASPDITVVSPQFHSRWDYYVQEKDAADVGHDADGDEDDDDDNYGSSSSSSAGSIHFTLVPSTSNRSTNPFVEKTLRVCLTYLLPKSRRTTKESLADTFPLDITIQADNDFYSVLPHLPDTSKESRVPSVVSSLPKFLPCPKDPSTGEAIVHKTGLGSSAALTTSLVGALVHYFLGDGDDDADGKSNENDDENDDENISTITMIHNLAQICHCHAQGKVGSGFDVSSACYGTHVYRCFPKCLLPDLLQQLDAEDEHHKAPNNTLTSALAHLVELDPWKGDMVSPPLRLPPRLQILLADVRGGSESPSMARTVLKWKTDAAASSNKIPFWSDLVTLNQRVIDIMNQFMTTATNGDAEGDDDVEYTMLANYPANEWSERLGSSSSSSNSVGAQLVLQLHETFCEIRTNLRQMGEAAGVPIEPPPQTKLCDATMALPGVVAAVVPGAGGYDAVVCLYIDTPDVLRSIGTLWSNWSDPIICPLAVHASETGIQLEQV